MQAYPDAVISTNKLSVSASAPGKVILFGEHSVVYGKPAIAAALSDLRISVLLTPTNNDTNDIVEVVLPDLGQMVRLRKSAIGSPSFDPNYFCMPPTTQTFGQIESALRKCRESKELEVAELRRINFNDKPLNMAPVVPIVYLLKQLAPGSFWDQDNSQRIKIWVSSKDLPVGAGLGSSAAFSVALAATLLKWRDQSGAVSDHVAETVQSAPLQPTLEERNEINKFAFASEILLTGTPSGLDNAVSTHGGALWYTKMSSSSPDQTHNTDSTNKPQSEKASVNSVTALASFPQLKMLLVHTHVPRTTKALVAKVRSLYLNHTPIIQPILQAMAEIVVKVKQLLIEDGSRNYESTSAALLELVRLNQDCLRTLGVSHPRLDRIDQIVRDRYSEVAAAKLTGAGGGGCALVLLRPSKTTTGTNQDATSPNETVLQAIERDLKQENFSVFRSTVGGPGVLWENPNDFSITGKEDEEERDDSSALRSGELWRRKKSHRALVAAENRWPLRLAAFLGGMATYFAVKLVRNPLRRRG